MILKIYRLNKNNPLPDYMSPQASGIDLYASLNQDVSIEPGGYKIIPTGISISLPKGYEAQLRPRSGLALKHGITLLNSPGTVDADYRGEIKVILINQGEKPFTVRNRMRIAQMVICKVWSGKIVELLEEQQAKKTERNNGGFGHTGV